MEAPRPALIFPHSPKTGGGLIERALRRGFRERYLRLQRFGRRRRFDPETVLAARPLAIGGNFEFDLAEASLRPLFAAPPLYIGLVRDPLDRARSLYGHIRREGFGVEESARRLGVPYSDDINEVIQAWIAERPHERWERRRLQCRFVGGGAAADQAIETARSRYLAVVTTASAGPLAEILSGGRFSRDHRRNVSASETFQVDPGLARAFRETYAEDLRLFEWVRSREAEMLARAAEALPALLAVVVGGPEQIESTAGPVSSD